MEMTEEKTSNAPWQIRCSPDQKRSFQKFVETTGLPAQEAIARGFEALKIQTSEDSTSKQVLFEFDSLISRLQSIIRAQILVALEKQTQCDEEKTLLQEEKTKYQSHYDDTYSKINSEFDLEKLILEKKFLEKYDQLDLKYKSDLENRDSDFIALKEKYEKLESDFQNLEREKSIIQKQASDSLKLYDLADSALYDCKIKVKEFEEKAKTADFLKERIHALEKENSILQVRLESLAKEESTKREYLEKDLRKDFEIKMMRNSKNIEI